MLQRITNHEIGLIELFVLTRELFRKNKTMLLLITACIYFPLDILSAIVNSLMGKTAQNIDFVAIASNAGLMEQFINSSVGKKMLLYYVIYIAILVIFVPVGTMAVSIGVKKAVFLDQSHQPILDQASKLDWKYCIAKAISFGIYIIPASILYFFAATFGYMIFILPGFFITVIWYFHPYAIALSNQKAISALSYSGRLIKGRFFRTMADLIAFFLLSYILSFAASNLFSLGGNSLLVDVLCRFVLSSINCVLVTGLTIYYLNREHFVMGKIYQEDASFDQHNHDFEE